MVATVENHTGVEGLPDLTTSQWMLLAIANNNSLWTATSDDDMPYAHSEEYLGLEEEGYVTVTTTGNQYTVDITGKGLDALVTFYRWFDASRKQHKKSVTP